MYNNMCSNQLPIVLHRRRDGRARRMPLGARRAPHPEDSVEQGMGEHRGEHGASRSSWPGAQDACNVTLTKPTTEKLGLQACVFWTPSLLFLWFLYMHTCDALSCAVTRRYAQAQLCFNRCWPILSFDRRKTPAEDASTAPAKQAMSSPVTRGTLMNFSRTPTCSSRSIAWPILVFAWVMDLILAPSFSFCFGFVVYC